MILSSPDVSLNEAHELSQGNSKLNEYRGSLSVLIFYKEFSRLDLMRFNQTSLLGFFSNGIEETPPADFLADQCAGVNSLFEIKESKIKSLVFDVEKVLEHFDSKDAFNSTVPNFIKSIYAEKIDDELILFPITLQAFYDSYSKGKAGYKILKGDKAKGNSDIIHLAKLFQKNARINSNKLFKYFKLKQEIEMINRLYKTRNKKLISQFEQMFQCEIN